MICKHCNAQIPEQGMFCPFCGQKAEPETVDVPAEEVVEIPEETTQQTPVAQICAACGSPLEPGSRFCRECGHYMTDSPVPRQKVKPAAKEPRVRKPVKWGLVAAICGALVLALVVTAGFFTDWFGLTGPVRQIALAARQTTSAENLTMELAISVTDPITGSIPTQSFDGTVQMSFVPSKRQLILCGDMKLAGEPGLLAIYDNHFIMDNPSGCYSLDIREGLEDMFDDYEEALKKNRDLKDILEELEEFPADKIDFDELEKCLKTYVRRLNSSRWLKKNAGYSATRENGVTLHTFRPDLYHFLRESLPFFESAFKDKADYQNVLDGLEDTRATLQEGDVEIKIGVKDGKLVQIAVGVNEEKSTGIRMDIQFTKIGKTEIDTAKLEKLLKEATDINSNLPLFPDAGLDFLSVS